jgi:hypothetical protein
VVGESERPLGDQVPRRLVAGQNEEPAEVVQFVFAEPFPCHVGIQQRRNQVLASTEATLRDERGEVIV